MKQTDQSKIGSLSKWIEVATAKLAAPGRERIAREIEAHFAEAVEARVAQGEPKQSAEARALTDLGDPAVAAKRFRRSHFTILEAKCMANIRNAEGKIPTLF